MVADIKDLKKYFPEKSYDVIIEKGTLDALLVGEKNQWNYSTEAEDMIGGILEQVCFDWLNEMVQLNTKIKHIFDS